MTRDQLIQKRRRKKQLRVIAVGGGAAAVVLVALLVVRPMLNAPKKRKTTESTEVSQTEQVEEVSTDTAQRAVLADGRTGEEGWNVNDSGWWFLNDDGTVWVSGWKTIDGQQYWFTDNGYMATGWVNTGDVKDVYFDETGMIDTSKQQKLVALTYDDGPSGSTDKLLDALEKYNAKATFFVVGKDQVEYYTDTLKREFELGMEIGSHTYSHPWLNQLTAEEITEEIDKNDQLIAKTTGSYTTIMRPTGGGINEIMIETISKPMIQWDVDSLDWESLDADSTYERIVELTQDGSIVLMHDLFAPAADSAERTLNYLTSEGYKMVTVSQLAEAYGYEMEAGGQYYAFYPDVPNGSDMNRTKAEGIYDAQNGGTGW